MTSFSDFQRRNTGSEGKKNPTGDPGPLVLRGSVVLGNVIRGLCCLFLLASAFKRSTRIDQLLIGRDGRSLYHSGIVSPYPGSAISDGRRSLAFQNTWAMDAGSNLSKTIDRSRPVPRVCRRTGLAGCWQRANRTQVQVHSVWSAAVGVGPIRGCQGYLHACMLCTCVPGCHEHGTRGAYSTAID